MLSSPSGANLFVLTEENGWRAEGAGWVWSRHEGRCDHCVLPHKDNFIQATGLHRSVFKIASQIVTTEIKQLSCKVAVCRLSTTY
jgi:hypothetical protein